MPQNPFHVKELYALALANRSAALLRLPGMAGEALADVDAALALGSHPKPGKLEERRAKCVEVLRAQQNGRNRHSDPGGSTVSAFSSVVNCRRSKSVVDL